ncbi:MAG: S49 family peptidase, partial [bacterium]|nr:S49 family peptidase [bacterium]
MMIVTGRKTGWIRRWCAGVCLVGFAGLLVGCMPGGLLITPVSTQRELVEETLISEGWLARDKIAVIDVEGLLLNGTESRLFGEGEHPVSRLLEQLDKAAADSRVRAVILRINSPGGSVTASELMHQEITHFRERTGRPVFAMMMDVAASGGYHVACACDRILAHRTTVTGSIGVIMQLFNVSGTLAKIGMEAPAITSAENKAAGSPFKKMTSEQRAIFQTVVDELYADF